MYTDRAAKHTRQRDAVQAEAREGFVCESVVSCGHRWWGHQLLFVLVGGITPAQVTFPSAKRDQTMIRDGYARNAAAQILEHMLWTTEGRLRVNRAVLSEQWPQPGSKDFRLIETRQACSGRIITRCGSGVVCAESQRSSLWVCFSPYFLLAARRPRAIRIGQSHFHRFASPATCTTLAARNSRTI